MALPSLRGVLGVALLGLTQGLKLLAVPVGRVAELLLQEGEALGQRGVLRVARLDARELLRVLRVRLLQGPQLLGVEVRGVAHELLEVVHALLQRGVLHGGRRRVLGVLREVRGVLPVGGLQRGQLLRVPVGRVVHHALEVLQALGHRGVVRPGGLLVLRALALGRRVLAVGVLEGLQLLGVFVSRVAEEVLKVLEALLYGGVLDLGRPEALQVLGELAVRRAVLRVGVLERLQLLRVPVGAVAQQLLQVVQALRERGVRREVRLQGLQVLRLLAGGRGVLGVGVLQGLHLLVVHVRGVAQELLEVVEALGHGGVVREARQVLGVLVVGALQGLQLPRVLLGAVVEQALQVAEALI
mmetsp:Transcript_10077/g.31284  ORF Transcript_10077/g.31284 Transcript_10077/m.31284 type:complete len:356 (+) Transcript_10077:899-1966(+)